MKKFLALFLALLMCVGILASCGGGNNTDAATLDDAKELLDTMMKDKNGKVLANDYDVPAKLVIGDTEFEVTWKTDNKDIKVKESSKKGFWTIDLPNVNAKEVEYKLTATIKDADGKTIEATFTPKLAVIDNAGLETEFKANVEYKAYIKQVNLGYDVYVLNTTQKGENKFIETTMDPKEAAVFKFEIVEGGYKIYTDIGGKKNYLHATATPKADKPDSYTKTIGFAETTDCVFTYDSALSLFKIKLNGVEFGVGTYGTYETVSLSESKYFKADNINVKEGQFPMSFMTKENADKLPVSVKPENKDPEANTTLSIADAIALGNTKVKDQYTEAKYYIEGTIKEIQSDVYGNLVITDGTNDLLIYGTYSEDGKTRFDKLATKPAVGDKIKVYGVIGKYNDAQMKNGWIVGAVAGENAGGNTGDNTGDALEDIIGNNVVTDLKADVAYKVFLKQVNKGSTYFALNTTQDNKNKFINTTTDPKAGATFYVEVVTGGYKFYTMIDNVKNYVHATAVPKDGTTGFTKSIGFATETTTVFTYDATLGIYKVTIDGTEFGVGTYGTYETISLSEATYFKADNINVKDGQFPIGFVTAEYANSINASTTPDTPDTPACTEHADADNNYVCDTEGCDVVVEPAADSTLTLPQANALGAALKGKDSANKYTVVGTIVEVEDISSGKMTIKDENDVTLYVYKVAGWADMDEKPVAGDVITLYGIIGSYQSVAQIENAEMKALQHTHAYSETNGKCACGAVDPDFVPSHECADGDDEDFICDNPDCNEFIEPAKDTVLTIPQANALGAYFKNDNGGLYTTNWYYVVGTIKDVYNTTHGNMHIVDADGNEFTVYGTFSADGTTRYDALEDKPVAGDTVKVYGHIGAFKQGVQMEKAWIVEHTPHTCDYADATCTTPKTCKLCGATDGEALEHNYVDGTCDACGASKPVAGSTLATFEFGDSTAENNPDPDTSTLNHHKDPNAKFGEDGKTYTDGTYNLIIESPTNVYDNGNDEKGNSCLKLGTSSAKGSFEFTVAKDVNKVIIKVAMYKAKPTTVSVNGIEQEITTSSNDGAYTSIEVDTSINKTVTFATITNRAMIDAIIFIA